MSNKLKPILITVFALGVLAFNLSLFWKSYRTVLVSHGKRQKVEDKINFDQLNQAVDFLEQRKKPVFEITKEVIPPQTPSRKNWQIEVLNGSGVAGAAGKLSEKLSQVEDLTVASIGNTERTTTSLLQSKKSIASTLTQQVLDIVRQDFANVRQEELPDEAEMDIVVILGK